MTTATVPSTYEVPAQSRKMAMLGHLSAFVTFIGFVGFWVWMVMVGWTAWRAPVVDSPRSQQPELGAALQR